MTETFSSPLLQASWCSFTLLKPSSCFIYVYSSYHNCRVYYVVIGIVSLTLVRCDLSVLLKTALSDCPYQTTTTRLAYQTVPIRLALSDCPYQTGPTRLSYQTNPYQTLLTRLLSLPDCPCHTVPTIRLSLPECPYQSVPARLTLRFNLGGGFLCNS